MPPIQANQAPLQAQLNASIEDGFSPLLPSPEDKETKDLLFFRELVHAPAGLLHAFSGNLPVEDTGLMQRTVGMSSIAADRSISADIRMHISPILCDNSGQIAKRSIIRSWVRVTENHHENRMHGIMRPLIQPAKVALSAIAGQGPISSSSHDPRLSAGREPQATRQEPEHSHDSITSLPNRTSPGKDGISRSFPERLSGTFTPDIARRLSDTPTPDIAGRLSDTFTPDIARRPDNAGISMRSPRDFVSLEAGGKAIENANISSRTDFPRLVLSRIPGMIQSGRFREPVEQFDRAVRIPGGRNTAFSEEPVQSVMAPLVRQRPPEASGSTWPRPSFSGESGQDLAEAPRAADLNSLADKVYTIIERRTKIEMERRGLYSRS